MDLFISKEINLIERELILQGSLLLTVIIEKSQAKSNKKIQDMGSMG